MRISVTLLDSYRYWRDGDFFTEDSEKRSYDELCMRIRGERTPASDAMLLGIAFHKVCELPSESFNGEHYVANGYEFDALTVDTILTDLPFRRVSEVKMTMEVEGHTLVGIADYMHGLDAGDLKTTKKVTPDKYADSAQWPAYLMMMEGTRFKYHVSQPRFNRSTGVVSLHDYKTFPFYRTQKTDDKVRRLVADFGVFAQGILDETNPV